MAEAPKQLVEALKKAVAAVNEAKVPKDLREVAFRAALAGVKINVGDPKGVDAVPPLTGDPSNDGNNAGGGLGEASDQLGTIASKLKTSLDAVQLAFDIDEDGVHLLMARSGLDPKLSVAQQEIALLVLAARQGAGIDEWTSVKMVRDATQNLGAYDSNHSTNIGQLRGPRVRIKGKGQGRELKLTQPGFEEAATILSRLAGSAA